MPKKLYCYVDESGQDTEGRFFVVVAIVVADQRAEVEQAAVALELNTGRGVHKWHTSRYRMQASYAKALPGTQAFAGHIFARIYGEGKNYLDRTGYVIADALLAYMQAHKLEGATTVITIDGLKEGEARQIGKVIRQRGVYVQRLRGARDESETLIRLADSVAGLLRNAYHGDDVTFKDTVERLKRNGILTDI